MSKRYYPSKRSRSGSQPVSSGSRTRRDPLPIVTGRGSKFDGSISGESGVRSRDGSQDIDVSQVSNPSLFGDYDNTNLDKVLEAFKNGDLSQVSGISQGLDAILQGYGSISSAERTDMLLQYILQMITTNDQRQFDKQVLAEQRLYDSPQNVLARLMGAGISRDAAIQLLSSMSGGSGSGAALIGSGSGVSVPGVSAPSGTIENQRLNTILSGVASIANALVSLAESGFSMYQAYQNIEFQKNQNYMTAEQVESFKSVNSIQQNLMLLEDSNKLGDKKLSDFEDAHQLDKYLRSIQENNTEVAALIQSPEYKRAFGTIYGREFLNQNFAARRQSKYGAELARYMVSQEELRTNTMALEQEKLGAEISNLGKEGVKLDAETQHILQSIINLETDVIVKNLQGEWIKVQTEQAKLDYDISSTGLPIMKENKINQLRMQALYFRALQAGDIRNDPYKAVQFYSENQIPDGSALQVQVNNWLQQPETAYDVMYLQQIHAGAMAGFAQEHPTLYKLCQVFSDLGIFDMVKTGGEAATIFGLMPK